MVKPKLKRCGGKEPSDSLNEYFRSTRENGGKEKERERARANNRKNASLPELKRFDAVKVSGKFIQFEK